MELIKRFIDLDKNDAGIAGGKGASLGEMTKAGIPVPPGFVVLSSSFEQFIEETDLVQEIDAILHKVDHKEIHTVEAASEKIRELILNAPMPQDIAGEINSSFKELNTKYVAVRSSATAEDGKDHAWAGQLESYLNTTEYDVLSKVKLCWSSLFTPRAIFYRFEKSLHLTKISVAVVVQKMVESEVSGIAFSVHPVTEDRNQLIIEAGFGLGEAIVSGSVTPDAYVVEKEPRNILDVNVSTQNRGLYRSEKRSLEHGNNEWKDIPEPKASSQVLTKDQILELSEIIIGIENHYGFPCDIEWAYEGGKFYIVQSRPITTLNLVKNNTQIVPSSEQGWFFIRNREIPAIWPLITYWDWDVTKETGLMDWLVYHIWDSNDYVGVLRKGIAATLGEYYLDRILSDKKWIGEVRKKSESAGENLLNLCRGFADKSKTSNLEQYIVFLQNLRKEYSFLMRENMFYWLFTPAVVKNKIHNLLKGLGEEEIKYIDSIMIVPDQKSYSNDVDEQLKKLAILKSEGKNIDKEVDDFVRAYHWFPYEYIGPKIYDKETVLDLISSLPPKTDKNESVDSKEDVIKKFQLTEDIVILYRILNILTLLQDDRKRFNSQVCYFVNEIILRDLGDILGIDLHLSRFVDEQVLIRYVKDQTYPIKEELLTRSKLFVVKQENGSQEYFVGQEAAGYLQQNSINWKIADTNIKSIKGDIAFAGKVRGVVRIIKNSGNVNVFNRGDILVSHMTTPDFIHLMKKAGAIITDEGGITCHAAIVSRELKKPCIIGTKIATQVFKDGDMVEVDAENGIVKIIR